MKIDNLNIGYACINVQLSEQGIKSSRDIRKDTLGKVGLQGVSDLVIQNLEDLKTILKWNNENGVTFYRMSSGIFPWMSTYELENLPQFDLISKSLQECGKIAEAGNQRLTYHPGPFVVLASPHSYIRVKARKELEQHSKIMDLMGLEVSTWSKINIHVGGAYGDKDKALDQWKREWDLLSDNAKARLVVENDDKASMYSVKDLYDGLHKSIGISITFDSFHHDFCTGELSKEDAARLAASTWKKDPCFHYSASLKLNENESAMKTAHADWIYEKLTNWGTGAWIMVEAKAKELAILHYRDFGLGKPNLNSLNESLKNTYRKFSHV
jgi:UV DNA damage endonuclease